MKVVEYKVRFYVARPNGIRVALCFSTQQSSTEPKKRQAPMPDVSVSRKYTRSNASSRSQVDIFQKMCFFCDQPSGLKSPLHNVSTLGLDTRV